MSDPLREAAALGRLRADPADQSARRLRRSAGLVVLLVGENPIRAARHARRRRIRQRPASPTRSITRPTSSSPAWRWPWPSMPGCSTSAARARPISPGLGVGAGLPGLRPCPALVADLPARHPRRRRLFGAAVGAHPGLSAGQARQPHRHHHDHVQLHRRRADGLPAGRRAEAAGLDGAADAQLRSKARTCRSSDWLLDGVRPRRALGAAQPVLPARAGHGLRWSGC